MRPALVALAILFLGAAGFGAAQFLETRRLRDAWNQERADLQKQIEDLKRQADRANRFTSSESEERTPRPRLSRPSGESDDPTTITTPDGATVSFRRGNFDARAAREWMNSPEMQKLRTQQQLAGLDFRYAALFRSLSLNPAQLERLKHLLVEKQSSVMDVMSSAQAEGLLGRENRGELRELVNEAQAEIDALIRSELGERGFAQYQNYEKTLPYRGTVDQLERRLSYSGAPLQPGQADQLAQILADTSSQRRGDGPIIMGAVNFATTSPAGGNVIQFGGGGSNISNDALVRAQGVLQPAQLDALRALQQEQLAAQQLQQQMREAMNRARTAPATPGTIAPAPTVPPPDRG